MDYLEKYESWINNPIIDEETKEELRAIANNKEEIEERFYKDLEFGTAGLRGIIGSGSNRMNKYTVGKATQGLANYILQNNPEKKGVAISYDSRHMSKEFSEITALCLNANGIKTYIFEELRPVPELSYAVRELNCIAGVMITASHNPPEYNGYKVYWGDGAQIVAPIDKGIIDEVNKVADFANIKTIDKQEAIDNGLYNVIGKEFDDKFIEQLKALALNPNIIKEMSKDLKIVYTPLHGTGGVPVKRILSELGFENVYIVPEQEKPNGDFPTVDYPNPEDLKAFKLALELAKKVDADVVVANDPDADRLGVFSKDVKSGEYKSFTGNMSALLIAEYELSQKRLQGKIPENGALITTIVSSNLASAIAKEYNLKFIEVYTGTKNIGAKMREFDETHENTFMFGFEESNGCLVGDYARDKDGIGAVMAICEAAAFYKKQGYTIWDQMNNIYKKYGYYKEKTIAIVREGIKGAEEIKQIMENIRNNPPTRLGNYDVIEFRDYKIDKIKNFKTGEERKTGLPESNVLYFDLENSAWCAVRPSGTEPKIKFYIGVKEETEEKAEDNLNKLVEAVEKLGE